MLLQSSAPSSSRTSPLLSGPPLSPAPPPAAAHIPTLPLPAALPISLSQRLEARQHIKSQHARHTEKNDQYRAHRDTPVPGPSKRSEEHTSELQSRFDLVCRLLLEKKNAPERRW